DRLEQSWRGPASAVPPAAPLLHDFSLVRYQGAQSIMGLDLSAARSIAERTFPGGTSLPQSVPVRPSQIGPYQILEELGRGGMGVVYRARDPRLDRIVAIKVLPIGMPSEDSEQRLRFQREALAV